MGKVVTFTDYATAHCPFSIESFRLYALMRTKIRLFSH